MDTVTQSREPAYSFAKENGKSPRKKKFDASDEFGGPTNTNTHRKNQVPSQAKSETISRLPKPMTINLV